ncbi:leucine-rich repeat serine/threonine-protein kinase 1-like isoform X3 [Dysidea avara]|uniref:leucine-rich repeat serine/threonine-protein kinase 1-like isoform X3 n=1 Tax=Dysidea avara TaxID=196820 RepID=UPI00331D3567
MATPVNSIPQKEEDTGEVTEVDEKSLIVAACDDNISLIEDYLTYCDNMDKDLELKPHGIILAKVLHKAVECCSVKVVETLVNSPHVDMTYVDPENRWNALHYATATLKSFTPASDYKNLQKIIYLLFKRGINPTNQDVNGNTPLEIALLSRFDRLTALIELLQKIWNSRSTDYVETHSPPVFSIYIHKELLQWAIELDCEEMVQQILLMYPKLSRDSRSKAAKVSANSRNHLLEDGWSAFHLAIEQKCVNAFRALLAVSGFTLTEIVNFCPKECKRSLRDKVTTLSSILISDVDSANPLMDVLIESNKNYRQYDNLPITDVDLSYTHVGDTLCPIIFRLKSIKTLNASYMQLSKLPFHKLSHYPQLLTHLDVSSNNLDCLPEELFSCLYLEFLNVSHNPLGCLPENWWKSHSLRRFWASSANLNEIFSIKSFNEVSSSFANSQGYAKPSVYHRSLKEISHLAIFEDQKVSKLRDLKLNENDISEFPHCFACIFPLLENLNLSKNKLATVCCIQEFPATLVRLDLSYNWLSSSDTVPFVFSPAGNCFASQNTLACGHMLHCELPRLQELCLSHNHNLNKLNFTCLPSDNLVLCLHENDEDNTEHVFFPNLTRLEVNNCQLRELPCRLDLMSKLRSLDMSDNPIRNIPFEICHLEKLEEFKYKNILDELTYEVDQRKTVTAKRYFLKFYKDEAVSDPSVRLVFVGLSGRGKSTLLHHLRWVDRVGTIPVGWRDRMDQEDCGVQHTIGVDQDVWYYSKSQDEPARDESSVHKLITFYTWDFAGQEEYYATHQCYLTRKALYVICWRVTDGIEGVMELKEWLLSIQAKAKDAVVVIVGTHVDMIVRK